MMFGYNFEIEHTPIMREIVKATGCETYLELGVSVGYNIHAMSPYVNNCIGVDIEDIRKHFDFKFYKMSTDKFFSQFKGKADIIFIDADHGFEAVKKDFVNSISILSKNGIIFIHDTDPVSREYLNPKLCNDSYRVIDWIAMTHSDLDILTLPISVTGLTMVKRFCDRRIYEIRGI